MLAGLNFGFARLTRFAVVAGFLVRQLLASSTASACFVAELDPHEQIQRCCLRSPSAAEAIFAPGERHKCLSNAGRVVVLGMVTIVMFMPFSFSTQMISRIGGPSGQRVVPRPSKLFVDTPRKSRTRGSAIEISGQELVGLVGAG